MSVCEVGVGVEAAEVGGRRAVLDGGFGQAEGLNEDSSSVRPGDTVEGVEQNGGFGRGVVEPVLDGVKVEDCLQQGEVVGDSVDNGDLQGAVSEVTSLGQVQLFKVSSGSIQSVAPALTSGRSIDLYSLMSSVILWILFVTSSGAGPPLAVLNLIPKSALGPPGL